MNHIYHIYIYIYYVYASHVHMFHFVLLVLFLHIQRHIQCVYENVPCLFTQIRMDTVVRLRFQVGVERSGKEKSATTVLLQ